MVLEIQLWQLQSPQTALIVKELHPLYIPLNTAFHSLLFNYVLCPLRNRVEMANSIEARTSFLDHLLCEYINSLPPSMKTKPNKERTLIEKWILEEAVEPYVARETYERTEPPFFAPPCKKPNPKFPDLLKKFLTRENIDRLGRIKYDKASDAVTTYLKANDLRAYQDQQIIILYVVLSSQFNVAPYKPNKPTSAPIEATIKCNSI